MKTAGTPLISIVTPSLNQFRFLRACVASVDAQPLDAVEQLVIDGGSSDGTAEYLSGHPGRVGFWRSAPDRGQGDALNIGFARARGDWIGWQNSDDFYFPDAFASFLDVIRQFPAARVIIGDVAFVDADGRTTGSVGVAPVHPLRWLEGFWPYNQGLLIHREVLDRVGPVDVNLHLHMDTDLLARIAQLAPPVAYIDAVLGAFRQHSSAKTHMGEDDAHSQAERALLEARYGRRLWPPRGLVRFRHRLATHLARIHGFGPGCLLSRLAWRWSTAYTKAMVGR